MGVHGVGQHSPAWSSEEPSRDSESSAANASDAQQVVPARSGPGAGGETSGMAARMLAADVMRRFADQQPMTASRAAQEALEITRFRRNMRGVVETDELEHFIGRGEALLQSGLLDEQTQADIRSAVAAMREVATAQASGNESTGGSASNQALMTASAVVAYAESLFSEASTDRLEQHIDAGWRLIRSDVLPADAERKLFAAVTMLEEAARSQAGERDTGGLGGRNRMPAHQANAAARSSIAYAEAMRGVMVTAELERQIGVAQDALNSGTLDGEVKRKLQSALDTMIEVAKAQAHGID